jgi:hypothetical protein
LAPPSKQCCHRADIIGCQVARTRAGHLPAPAADQQRGRMPTDSDKPVRVKSTDDARAGASRQNVRYVLMISLIAAILLMIAIAAVSTH